MAYVIPRKGRLNNRVSNRAGSTIGCLAGLRAAANMRIARVTLETDTSLVKAAMEGDEYRLSAKGGVITELSHLDN